MRKLLTTLTALTMIGGVLLAAPARTLAVGESAVYWISNASVGAGTSCASPTHEYISGDLTARLNDLLDNILDEVAEEDYASVTIAICEADDGAQQVYEMDDDTDPEVDVAGAEITIVGVQWDATSDADVADAGDVVVDGNEDYSPFEFNNADVYIGYLTIRDAFDDNAGAAVHFEQDTPSVFYELRLDHVVIDHAWIDNGDGAGVYAEGSVIVADSTFTNNSALDDNGGAIYVSDARSVTISDSVFGDPNDATKGNYAEEYGGDIYVTGGGALANLSISNSQFYDAVAEDESGGSIAAICAESVISGVTIRGAGADENGAGMYFNDDSGCGTDYTVTVTNSRFLNNEADYQGGAIADGQDSSDSPLTEVTVSGSYFYQNEAEYGAAINLDGTTLTVSNSTFIENHAYEGGALELCDNEAVTVTGSRFIGNTAVDSGGAILQNCNAENHTIASNHFQRNTAGDQGGAIRVQWGSSGVSITSNTFTSNSAEQGGAVSVNDDEVDSYLWSITGNTFAENRATLNGGALHMALDNSGNVVTPNVKGNRFKKNSAPAAGAVVVESDFGTERVILKRYERGLRGNRFQANRATSDRRSANIGVHFD
jgi:predicted outer membrane repeat protein